LQGIVTAGGEGGIDQIDLVLLVEDAEFNAGRVDEGIGPGELDAVHAFLDREQAVLTDHGDIFGVVDRELRALAGGQRDEVHGGLERCGEGQQEQKRHEYAAEHDRFPLMELFLSYSRGGECATRLKKVPTDQLLAYVAEGL
jgi:hypothetical protein